MLEFFKYSKYWQVVRIFEIFKIFQYSHISNIQSIWTLWNIRIFEKCEYMHIFRIFEIFEIFQRFEYFPNSSLLHRVLVGWKKRKGKRHTGVQRPKLADPRARRWPFFAVILFSIYFSSVISFSIYVFFVAQNLILGTLKYLGTFPEPSCRYTKIFGYKIFG